MKIVWQLEQATVRDVYEALREHRDVAYTTVMTMMKILEEKKFLKKTQVDRAYEYRPAKPAPAGRRRDGARLPRPRLRRRGRAAAGAPGQGRQALEVGQGRHAPADGRDGGMTMLALANLAAWILQTTILVGRGACRHPAAAPRRAGRALPLPARAARHLPGAAVRAAPRRAGRAARGTGGGVGVVRARVWSSAPRRDRLQDAAVPARCRDDARRDRDGAALARGSPRAFWRLRRLRRAGEAAASLEACDDLAGTVTRAAVRIRFVPRARAAADLRFPWRRSSCCRPLSASQPVPIQRAVLAHELWHVRRRDWLWTVCEESRARGALVPSGHLVAALAHPVGARRSRRRADAS